MSLPVLQLLQEPRDWTALDQWAKDARFGKSRLRHALAWLEQRGEAGTFVEGRARTLFWASVGWLKQHNGPLHSRT
jgi:hypothetical protein